MTDIDDKLVDINRLSKWMDEQKLSNGEISDIDLLVGGTQNILVKFSRGGEVYVLRRPPEHLRKNSNETMRREARVLAALADSNVPHPKLIASCPEEDILGVSFYLMEAIEGFNPVQGLKSFHAENQSARARMGLSMVDAISELAKLDYQKLGLNDFGKVEGYLDRQVGRWQKQLDSYSSFEGYPGPDIPGVNDVANWLNENIPPNWQAGIIHGDYHLGNVMFQNDSAELAAVVDWELSTIGDPLIDLGWLLATWPDEEGSSPVGLMNILPWSGFANSEELIGHYGRVNNRDLSHITWYAVLACYKLGIILEGTHARAFAGKAPGAIGDYLHSCTVLLFERALNWLE